LGLVKWDVSKSTGIEEIDSNHRKFIDVINRLDEARLEGTTREVLPEVLAELKRYSRAHLRWEETYLLQPKYLSHREQHREFIRQLEAFEKELAHDISFTAIRLLPYLMDWLVNHIMCEDMQYCRRNDIT
jgi:hemerythrin